MHYRIHERNLVKMYWIVNYIWENMSYILNPLGGGTKNVNLTLNLCLETTAHIICKHQPYCSTFLLIL